MQYDDDDEHVHVDIEDDAMLFDVAFLEFFLFPFAVWRCSG